METAIAVGIFFAPLIISAIFLGIVSSVIYSKKGYSKLGGFLLGFFLGIVGIIIVLLSRNLNDRSFTPEPNRSQNYRTNGEYDYGSSGGNDDRLAEEAFREYIHHQDREREEREREKREDEQAKYDAYWDAEEKKEREDREYWEEEERLRKEEEYNRYWNNDDE